MDTAVHITPVMYTDYSGFTQEVGPGGGGYPFDDNICNIQNSNSCCVTECQKRKMKRISQEDLFFIH